MTKTEWKPIKVRFCDHVNCEVALEVEAVYPAEHLPEQLPRLLAHRCSQAARCNGGGPACIWAGTNPAYDPFLEPDSPKP